MTQDNTTIEIKRKQHGKGHYPLTRTLYENGERMYSETIYNGRFGNVGAIINFEIDYASRFYDYAQSRTNASNNRSEALGFLGKARFKRFNFKQKLLYFFLKKFFLDNKAPSANEIVSISFNSRNEYNRVSIKTAFNQI